MDMFTVSFFDHREVKRASEIEERLDKLLHDLITQKEYVDFLIGRDGDFDLLASSVIKRAVKAHGYGNTCFTLVLPYMKAEYTCIIEGCGLSCEDVHTVSQPIFSVLRTFQQFRTHL